MGELTLYIVTQLLAVMINDEAESLSYTSCQLASLLLRSARRDNKRRDERTKLRKRGPTLRALKNLHLPVRLSPLPGTGYKGGCCSERPPPPKWR